MIEVQRYAEFGGWKALLASLTLVLVVVLILDMRVIETWLETWGLTAFLLYLGLHDYWQKRMWSSALMLAAGFYFLIALVAP